MLNTTLTPMTIKVPAWLKEWYRRQAFRLRTTPSKLGAAALEQAAQKEKKP